MRSRGAIGGQEKLYEVKRSNRRSRGAFRISKLSMVSQEELYVIKMSYKRSMKGVGGQEKLLEVKRSKWRSVEANGGQWKLHSSGAKGGCTRRGKKGGG